MKLIEDSLFLIPIVALLLSSSIALIYILYLRKTFRASLPKPEDYEKTLNLNGTEVFYQDLGSGPALVFLHGIGASSYTWRFQLEEFSKSHRVIIPDLPGFGRSEKNKNLDYHLKAQGERLISFLEKTKVSSCFLVGSSMGGLIALWIAANHPELVKKLVLLAPASEPKVVPKGIYQMGWSAGFFRAFVNKQTISSIMKRVNANHEVINDKSIEMYMTPYQSKEAITIFIKATKTLREKGIPELVKIVKTPTLILYGQKDNMVPEWTIKNLYHSLENSFLKTNSEGGHHIQEDDFAWTNEQIKSFLD